MVLNDIELVGLMRPLNLIKNGIFNISYLYLSEDYLEVNERQIIRNLDEIGDLKIFDLTNDFYDFYYKNCSNNLEIGITDISSVYYAKINEMPLVTRCKLVENFAIKNNVIVYEPCEALKITNASAEHINFLDYMIKIA